MFELTNQDFLAMRARRNEPCPAGHIDAGLEFRGPNGEVCAFYTAQLSPTVSDQPDVAGLGELVSVQLRESEEHEWTARLQGHDPEKYLDSPIPAQEVQTVLERFHLLPLPMNEALENPDK